jgi:hypothetical protein
MFQQRRGKRILGENTPLRIPTGTEVQQTSLKMPRGIEVQQTALKIKTGT